MKAVLAYCLQWCPLSTPLGQHISYFSQHLGWWGNNRAHTARLTESLFTTMHDLCVVAHHESDVGQQPCPSAVSSNLQAETISLPSYRGVDRCALRHSLSNGCVQADKSLTDGQMWNWETKKHRLVKGETRMYSTGSAESGSLTKSAADTSHCVWAGVTRRPQRPRSSYPGSDRLLGAFTNYRRLWFHRLHIGCLKQWG